MLPRVVGLAWASVAVIALTGAAPVQTPRDAATTSQVTLDVRGGFDGYYKVGGWLPIFAIASNEGPPIDGTLKLAETATGQSGDSYGAVANLPTHSRKLLEFAAPASQTDRTRTVTLSNGNDVVLTRSLPLNPLGPRDYLYGVVSPSAGTLRVLQGRRQNGGTISVAHLSLADIPAFGPALADLDALVVDDTATSALSVPQRQALSAWVASGGQLIVCGGLGAERTISGMADLIPLDLKGTQAVDLGASLAAWGGAADAGRAATAIGQPKSGSIVRLRAGAIPLVVDRPMGRGWVTLVALGADEPSLRDGEGAAAFWTRVLSGARTPLGAGALSPGIDASSRDHALYAMPETALPSSANLALFVFGYILAVGPLSAFVLAWFDRREWLWVTIPVISLLFAAGAYLVALDVKGTSLVVNSVSIARGTEGRQGTETRSYVGIFSPRRGSYNVRLSGAKGVAPLDTTNEQHRPVTLSDGDAVLVRDVRIEQWAVRALDARHNNTTRPPIESSLTLSGSSLDGWVRNTGPQPLEDAMLAVGGDRSSIGLLSPGQQTNVHLTLTGTARPSSSQVGIKSTSATPTIEQRRRAALLAAAGEITGLTDVGATSTLGPDQAWSTSGARIVAFDTVPPFPISIEGHVAREHDLTLQVVDVPVAFGSAVHVRTGFARRDLLENAGLASGYYGSGLPLGTSTTVQLALPPEVAGATWTALRLHIDVANANSSSGRNGSRLSVALYNWNSGQWDAQPTFASGVNAVNPPAPYVDERGFVRVRFTGSNGQDELQGLDIDATGARS